MATCKRNGANSPGFAVGSGSGGNARGAMDNELT